MSHTGIPGGTESIDCIVFIVLIYCIYLLHRLIYKSCIKTESVIYEEV